jgi:uncharacterized protein (UPF0276 family)
MQKFSLGQGINLRRSVMLEVAERLRSQDPLIRSQLNWGEIVPENFMGRGGDSRRALLEVAQYIPISVHGVCLSLGSVDPLNWDYLSQLKILIQETKAFCATDHLSYSSAQGVEFHHLLPLPFNEETVQYVVERIKRVQDFLEVPFGIENPSYYQVMPESEMTEAQFISEVLEQSNCFLLLDVNNVYVNCYNHSAGEDSLSAAIRYLHELPLERVQEVHVAGHGKIILNDQAKLLDTHGAPVPSVVQALLRELHRMQPVTHLLLEREQNIPPLNDILEEVSGLWKMIWNESQVRSQTSQLLQV